MKLPEGELSNPYVSSSILRGGKFQVSLPENAALRLQPTFKTASTTSFYRENTTKVDFVARKILFVGKDGPQRLTVNSLNADNLLWVWIFLRPKKSQKISKGVARLWYVVTLKRVLRSAKETLPAFDGRVHFAPATTGRAIQM